MSKLVMGRIQRPYRLIDVHFMLNIYINMKPQKRQADLLDLYKQIPESSVVEIKRMYGEQNLLSAPQDYLVYASLCIALVPSASGEDLLKMINFYERLYDDRLVTDMINYDISVAQVQAAQDIIENYYDAVTPEQALKTLLVWKILTEPVTMKERFDKMLDEVVVVLIPHMQNQQSRRSYADSALYGCDVLSSVDYTGSAFDFTVRFVRILAEYDNHDLEEPALIIFLNKFKESLGTNKQNEMTALVERLKKSPLIYN